jgi:2-C-methyl-D-erythritol 2,4-cyclodiphosphate synthase
VVESLNENGWYVSNLDVTVIAQAPRLSPYIEAMRERLAEVIGVDVAALNIKATTTENLGFTGRGEGIAAQAIALLSTDA